MSQFLENQAAFQSKFLGFVYRQWLMYQKPFPTGTSLSGQTAIVTGSNSGLGFESARQLLQLGLSNLVVAVRSQAKGDTAANKLRDEFPNAVISVWILDMESYESVTAFAERCDTLPRIDIVILNAGVQSDKFTLVKATQHEKSFQVNYLSTSLLAILLLPILKSKKVSNASPPRLSIVSSDTSYWAPLKTTGPILAQFDQPNLFESLRAYTCSKLTQLFFISQLAAHVNPDDVIINASNPGLCKGTEFFRDDAKAPLLQQVIMWCFTNFNGRTAEAGANAMLDAVIVKGRESHGSFVSDWTIQPYPTILYTKEGQGVGDRIWEETMEELNSFGASKIVQEMKN